MEANVFEFWSRYFHALAQGRRQMEAMTQGYEGGGSGYEYVYSLFRGLIGGDKPSEGFLTCLDMWRKSAEVFQTTMKESLSLFDVVPREEYNALANRCAEMENALKEKDETIARLETLLGGDAPQPTAMAESFRRILEKQQEEFQGLVHSLSSLFGEKNTKPTAPRKRR